MEHLDQHKLLEVCITPARSVHKSRGDSVVHMWVLQRGHSGDLASTLCKYDLRKGDLFVLSWASLCLVCIMWHFSMLNSA